MKVLLNCLKNLDMQVKELYILAQSNNEKHIKVEKHLPDLTDSINFVTKKCDGYEKDRTEKKKLTKNLRGKVSPYNSDAE